MASSTSDRLAGFNWYRAMMIRKKLLNITRERIPGACSQGRRWSRLFFICDALTCVMVESE